MFTFHALTSLREKNARLQSQAQTHIRSLGATRQGRSLLVGLFALAALAIGALMAGVVLSGGRSTLFVLSACCSLPMLLVLPDAEKKRFILLAFCAALLLSGIYTVSTKGADAVANFNIAYNILENSVITTNDPLSTPPEAMRYSSYREPLFPVTLIPFMALARKDLSSVSDPGERLDALRVHPWLRGATCLWTAFLLLGLWKMGTFKNRHYIAVWLSLAFTFIYFCRQDLGEMLTEIPAATLLAWLAWAYMKALDTGRTRWLLLAGAFAALLALVKMLFLYIFLLSAPVLALALYWCAGRARCDGRASHENRDSGESGTPPLTRLALTPLVGCAALLGLYVVIVTATHPGVGVKDIFYSGRGDSVLAIRALKNTMSPDERLGTLYAYSRGAVHDLAGLLLQAGERDIRRGGRWERLSRGTDRIPDSTGRDRYILLPKAEHRSYYALSRVAEKRATAKTDILNNLPLHLAMTPIFLYRGVFGLATGSTGLALFLYCAWAFAASLLKRRAYDLVVLWYPLAFMGAYALSSHFIARYAEPIGPVLQTFFCVHAAMLLNGRGGKQKQSCQ